jgi:ribosomal protein S27E
MSRLKAEKLKKRPPRSPDVSKIKCLVCLGKNLVYINGREVGCECCGSIYTLEILLKKKG